MDKRKRIDIYLSQAKKTLLSHSLGGMVAQVLIIFSLDDWRNLLDDVLGAFAEKDGGFLGDGTLTNHQAFPLSQARLRGQFAGGRCLTNHWPGHLGLFRLSVHSFSWFSFHGWVSHTSHLRRQASLLFLFGSSFLLDVSLPLAFFHFYIKMDI